MDGRPFPDGSTKAETAAHRRRGAEAVRIRSGLQFAVGDLLVEVLTCWPRGHGEVGRAIEEFAQRIDISASTLRKYYQVARQWPQDRRRPDVCWSVHERLAYVPDRYTLIRTDPYDPVSNDYRWTVKEAERASRVLGGAAEHGPAASVAEENRSAAVSTRSTTVERGSHRRHHAPFGVARPERGGRESSP